MRLDFRNGSLKIDGELSSLGSVDLIGEMSIGERK
jgi:hypothetical protein